MVKPSKKLDLDWIYDDTAIPLCYICHREARHRAPYDIDLCEVCYCSNEH